MNEKIKGTPMSLKARIKRKFPRGFRQERQERKNNTGKS
jgi:hypothetical protein